MTTHETKKMTMNTTYFMKTNSTTDISIGTHSHENIVRRKASHTPMRLPVQFELPGGPVISAYAYNLSLKGMQVRCDLSRIKDFADYTKSASDIPVLVVMRLQVGNRLSSQVLRCRLCYQRELQDAEVVLGLEFDALLPDQQQALLSVMLQTQDSAVRN